MADSDDKKPDGGERQPEVDRRKGPKDRRSGRDRRSPDRVVTELNPRRKVPDRRKK